MRCLLFFLLLLLSYNFAKAQVEGGVLPGDSLGNIPAADSVVVKKRSPLLAGALSFMLPGCGQYYNGKPLKCTLMLSSYLVLSTLGFIAVTGSVSPDYSTTNHRALMAGGGLLLSSFMIYLASITDAVVEAHKINKKNRLRGIDLGNGRYLIPALTLMPSSNGIGAGESFNPGLALSFSF